MKQSNRDAMRERIAEIVEAAGPDGISFREIYEPIRREFHATRRHVQDELFRLDRDGITVTGGLTADNVCVYRSARYKSEMSEREREKAAIYAFRPLKTLFSAQRPSRFDVR